MNRLVTALATFALIFTITLVQDGLWPYMILPSIGVSLGSLLRSKRAVLIGFGLGLTASSLFTLLAFHVQKQSDPGVFELFLGMSSAVFLPLLSFLLLRSEGINPTLDALVIQAVKASLWALLGIYLDAVLFKTALQTSSGALGSAFYMYGIAPLFTSPPQSVPDALKDSDKGTV